MSDTVNALAGSTVRPEWALPPEQSAPTNELGQDAFLQLLVAQLKYQDPLEPQTSDEFIATTAQFTMVEKLEELTRQGENTALINSLTTAGALVGREVTANVDGVPVTAVVERSSIRSGEVVLETSAGALALGQIVSIGAVPAAPAEPTAVDTGAATGDPATGDTAAGDTATGDTATGDTAAGDETAGAGPS